jgi:ADP-heptose:LPS heptosyltransferase
MHIAVLVGVPLVAIVGGTPARVVLPEEPQIRYLEDPELQTWDEQGDFTPRTSRLNEIMPEAVYAKVLEVI